MGIFSPIAKRSAYVPPSDGANSPTLLTGADPSLVRVSGGDDPNASNDGRLVAQQRPSPARPQPPQPQPSPTQLMAQPGRGYGELALSQLEQNLSADQKRANREQALHEIAQQPPARDATLLPDDWERTKPSEVVDDIRRAAQRHGVPTDLLARLLYEEGKFNEPDKLKKPLVMQSNNPSDPLGWAQITTSKLNDLKAWARQRGDLARLAELNAYVPSDRAKAFDVAAELLAYQHRLLGSWHGSVAAYNIGENFIQDWLNGLHHSDNGLYTRDPKDVAGNWKEMKRYLGIVLRGKPDEPPSSRIYDYRDSEQNFRVPSPIPRSPNTPDRWRISRDEYENA